ncbi:lysis protein [Enterobacteriaceae bacterium H18W14]|uniref:lysis protein n=1 Tax=Dryocola boscaweniae TaxID=2925397 RepID=UPI0022F04155|nr:lysis protein [Dryocola boscaweniae]MCT4716776.1 lysis protein [Dryocola boscaweniae]
MSTRLLLALLVFLSLAFGVYHFQSRYTAQKQLTAEAEKKIDAQSRFIDELQNRQRDVAALDAMYIQELANAQRTIENLQLDVAGGVKRLHLNATCKPLPAAAGSASVDDAARARLVDAAERDYFRLRERIAFVSKQLAGLQDYVRQQCMNPINKGGNK